MDIKLIAKKIAPHLKYGDKPAIAKASKINIRSVYNFFEGHSELVHRDKCIIILKAAIKRLKEKEAITEDLAKELKNLV